MNTDAIIKELIEQRGFLGDRAAHYASALADANAKIVELTNRIAELEQKPATGA